MSQGGYQICTIHRLGGCDVVRVAVADDEGLAHENHGDLGPFGKVGQVDGPGRKLCILRGCQSAAQPPQSGTDRDKAKADRGGIQKIPAGQVWDGGLWRRAWSGLREASPKPITLCPGRGAK